MKFLNKYIWSPHTLDDYYLEEIWIDFKVELLATSSYEKEKRYSFLYDRCKDILLTVINRHRHLILDGESIVNFQHHFDFRSLPFVKVKPEDVPLEALPGLILIAYIGGGSKKFTREIVPDPLWISEAVDYLIKYRKEPIGLFLKGLILKYGICLHLPPNISAAERYLKSSLEHGIGSAEIELAHIRLHRGLPSHISSIHDDYNGYHKWVVDASKEVSELAVFSK